MYYYKQALHSSHSLVTLEMILLLLLFLNLLDTASSITLDGPLLPISSATAKTTFSTDYLPAFAIDGNPSTLYASTSGPEPQWLKLQLEEPALVSRVAIVNR
eukprot:sb/3478372/